MPSRRTRIVAPFAVAGLIGAGALVPTLRAGASPDLAKLTSSQLIQKALDEHVTRYSGGFSWQASLGLPSISGLVGNGQSVSTDSSFDPTSLLSGTHDFEIWVDGAGEQRIAAPGPLSESDVVHRGNQAWLWDSGSDHVTHYVVAGSPSASARPTTPMDGLDVASVARTILGAVSSVHSDVAVAQSTDVAGRSAYVLRITPDRSVDANADSTVSAVLIAVDAATGMPLRVTVDAVGQSGPALQIGYTSFHPGTPSSSVFAVPTGATTTTRVVQAPGRPAPVRRHGPQGGWFGYRPLTSSTATVTGAPRGPDSTPPHGTGARWASGPVSISPPAGRPAIRRAGWFGSAPLTRHLGGPRSGWSPGARFAGGATTGHTVGADWGTISVVDGSSATTGRSAKELATVTTAVSGPWGSGRLLQSSLVDALFLGDGKVLVGFVSPAALEAAAAHLGHS